jgi:hypothetical protein
MRRLVCLLALCALAGCASAKSDSGKEEPDRPPSAVGPGTVAIWTIAEKPLRREWPRVKTWIGNITSCNRSTTGPDIGAVTEDGLPVTIQVLQPADQLPRLAATVEYAADGRQPHGAKDDRRLFVVSDEPLSPEQAGDGTSGSFSGSVRHGPKGQVPPENGKGTLGHISWRCPGH